MIEPIDLRRKGSHGYLTNIYKLMTYTTQNHFQWHFHLSKQLSCRFCGNSVISNNKLKFHARNHAQCFLLDFAGCLVYCASLSKNTKVEPILQSFTVDNGLMQTVLQYDKNSKSFYEPMRIAIFFFAIAARELQCFHSDLLRFSDIEAGFFTPSNIRLLNHCFHHFFCFWKNWFVPNSFLWFVPNSLVGFHIFKNFECAMR